MAQSLIAFEFKVSKITAEFLSIIKEIVIFASLKLPSGRTSYNQCGKKALRFMVCSTRNDNLNDKFLNACLRCS